MPKLNDLDRDIANLNLRPDIKYFGFLHKLKLKDKRLKSIIKEQEGLGVDRTESWNLDHVLAGFIYTRLQNFKKNVKAHPEEFTFEEWKDKIEDFATTFENIYFEKEPCFIQEKEKYEEYFKSMLESLKDFANYFTALWW